jgi:hypothetical protein
VALAPGAATVAVAPAGTDVTV